MLLLGSNLPSPSFALLSFRRLPFCPSLTSRIACLQPSQVDFFGSLNTFVLPIVATTCRMWFRIQLSSCVVFTFSLQSVLSVFLFSLSGKPIVHPAVYGKVVRARYICIFFYWFASRIKNATCERRKVILCICENIHYMVKAKACGRKQAGSAKKQAGEAGKQGRHKASRLQRSITPLQGRTIPLQDTPNSTPPNTPHHRSLLAVARRKSASPAGTSAPPAVKRC